MRKKIDFFKLSLLEFVQVFLTKLNFMEIQSPKKRAVSESQIKSVLVVLIPGYLSLKENLSLRLGVGKEEIGSNKENSFENQGFILVLKHYFLSDPLFCFRSGSMIHRKNKKWTPLQELSDQSIMRLKISFRGLSRLHIVGSDSNEIYQFLQLFEGVTALYYSMCNVFGNGYYGCRVSPRHFGHLGDLKILNFYDGEINPTTVKCFGNLKSLIKLKIMGCTFLEGSEQGLKELTGLNELTMWHNRYISLKGRDDGYLCHFTGLKVLELENITSVKYLCLLTDLESLELGHVNDISFVDLGAFGYLSSLTLNFAENMSLEGISKFCPNLDYLKFESEGDHFCQTINPLVGLSKLKSLIIENYNIYGGGTKVSQIGDICKITSLTYLKLWFHNPLSNEFCNSLKYLTGLETLSLWSLSLDYLDCLEYLPKSIHTLELKSVSDIST